MGNLFSKSNRKVDNLIHDSTGECKKERQTDCHKDEESVSNVKISNEMLGLLNENVEHVQCIVESFGKEKLIETCQNKCEEETRLNLNTSEINEICVDLITFEDDEELDHDILSPPLDPKDGTINIETGFVDNSESISFEKKRFEIDCADPDLKAKQVNATNEYFNTTQDRDQENKEISFDDCILNQDYEMKHNQWDSKDSSFHIDLETGYQEKDKIDYIKQEFDNGKALNKDNGDDINIDNLVINKSYNYKDEIPHEFEDNVRENVFEKAFLEEKQSVYKKCEDFDDDLKQKCDNFNIKDDKSPTAQSEHYKSTKQWNSEEDNNRSLELDNENQELPTLGNEFTLGNCEKDEICNNIENIENKDINLKNIIEYVENKIENFEAVENKHSYETMNNGFEVNEVYLGKQVKTRESEQKETHITEDISADYSIDINTNSDIIGHENQMLKLEDDYLTKNYEATNTAENAFFENITENYQDHDYKEDNTHIKTVFNNYDYILTIDVQNIAKECSLNDFDYINHIEDDC